MPTILLADDHTIVRQSLKMLLNAQDDLEVVAEVADGLDALDTVESVKPDVIVLDLMMPGLNGIEVARRCRNLSPDTVVVILTMYSDDQYIAEALEAGVYGYVLKMSSSSELVGAINHALSGQHYLSPSLRCESVETYLDTARCRPTDPYDTLTEREREVLQLTVEGNTSTDIGEILGISHRTVETHRSNLMRKLGIHSQTELVRYAARKGLMSLE